MAITLKILAVVKNLYFKLYKLFSAHLLELNIGYDYNQHKIAEMMDIVNAIDYIVHEDLPRNEIIKIIKRYE